MNDAPLIASAAPAPAAKRDIIVVQNEVPVLDTGLFEQMQRIAKIMAASNLVPEHLNRQIKVAGNYVSLSPDEAFANCFLVVNQSVRWRMDPFAVAQGVYVTKGKVGYEGKLIAAVINSHPNLAKRLSYRFEGVGADRKVTVSGRVKGDNEDREIDGTVKNWQTDNGAWTKIADQMLSYRGAREWARRWMPEAILGVYADEEVQQIELDITPPPRPVEASASVRMREAMAGDDKSKTPAASKAVADEAVKPTTLAAILEQIEQSLTQEALKPILDAICTYPESEERASAIRKWNEKVKALTGAVTGPDPEEKAAPVNKFGTVEQHAELIKSLMESADRQTLDERADFQGGLKWSKSQTREIIKAYEDRKKQFADQ